MPSISFATLWVNHPSNQTPPDNEPCKDKNGQPVFDNQCAIRMSVCFTKSGISLASYRGAFCWGAHGRAHAIRAEEFARWLDDDRVPFPSNHAERKKRGRIPITAQSYATRKGIVLFRNFWGRGNTGDHIDLWDGSVMAHGDASFFSAAREVWFWDIA